MQPIPVKNICSLTLLLVIGSLLVLGCDKPTSLNMMSTTEHGPSSSGKKRKTPPLEYSELKPLIKQGRIQEALQLVKASRANLEQEDKFGFTLLRWAAIKGHLWLVQALTREGANIHHQCQGSNALTDAVEQGHAEVANFLLGQGVDLYVKDAYGKNRLMCAADEGTLRSVRFVERYIAIGFDVNAQNQGFRHPQDTPGRVRDQGCTALMYAAIEGNLEVVKALLENGADPSLEDGEGHTAAWHAREHKNYLTAEKIADAIQTLASSRK